MDQDPCWVVLLNTITVSFLCKDVNSSKDVSFPTFLEHSVVVGIALQRATSLILTPKAWPIQWMIAIPSFVPSYAAPCNNHIYLLCSPCMCQKHNIDIRMHVTPSLGASPRKPEEGFCVRQAPHPFYTMFHISLLDDNDQYYICSTFVLSRCQSHVRRVYLQYQMLLTLMESLSHPRRNW